MINNLVQKIKEEQLNIYSIAVMDTNGLQEKRIYSADLATNSYSVAKAFTMTAIGMLWDRGQIRVEEKVYDILQEEFPKEFDLRWKEVTVNIFSHIQPDLGVDFWISM